MRTTVLRIEKGLVYDSAQLVRELTYGLSAILNSNI